MTGRSQTLLLLIGLAAMATHPGDLPAQEASRNLRVIPSVGSYFPVGDIGYGRGAGDSPDSPEYLSLTRGLSVGVAAETPILPMVGVRAVGIGAEWLFRSVTVQMDAEMFGQGGFGDSAPDGPGHGEAFLSFGVIWTP